MARQRQGPYLPGTRSRLWRVIPESVTCLHQGGPVDSVLLEHGPSPHKTKLFPFVPFFVSRKKSGQPYSAIEIALTMQAVADEQADRERPEWILEVVVLHHFLARHQVGQAGHPGEHAPAAEIPAKIPSSCAMRRHISSASSWLT